MKYEDTLDGALEALKIAVEESVNPVMEELSLSIKKAVDTSGITTAEAIRTLKMLGGNALSVSKCDDQTYVYSPIKADEKIIEQTRPETSAETDNPNKKCLLENFNPNDWYDNFMKNL